MILLRAVASVLKFLAPFIVGYIVALAIHVLWRVVLDEWPEALPSTILAVGITFVVLCNWPKKWQ
jgi:RsiW-degrading membrane proteinase PrsW (M82 family)